MKHLLLNIEPVKHDTYNCFFNNVIAGIFQYWNKDVRLSFLDSFAISVYIENGEYKIDCFTENFNHIMSEICGININRLRMNSDTELDEYIEYCIINSIPIGISIDSYYLPWNIYYLNHHRSHSLLIIGFDDDHHYYCIDGFLSMEIKKLSKEIIWNHYKALFSFDNYKDIMINKDVVFTSLKETASAYKNIIDISNYVKVGLTKEILERTEPARSSVLYHITDIGWSRNNFHKCLLMMKNLLELESLNDILDTINNCFEKWIIVKNLITKALIFNDFSSYYGKMQKYLYILDEEEKKVIDKIKHWN